MTERTNEAAVGQLAESDEMPKAWIAARVILVECPDNPANPIGVLPPEWGFEGRLLERYPTLKSVEGPFVNGIIALTWEDDPGPTDDLVARSAQAIHKEIVYPPALPAHPNPEPPTGDGGREGVGA